MFSSDDTIAALATPAGPSAVGLIRISGPSALAIAAHLSRHPTPLAPRTATLVWIDRPASVRDRALVTAFPAPHSYTGQDVVEVSTHGSPVLLRGLLEFILSCGARLAEPGEFTLRAFLNGKLDLIQAEAVADLIEAVTPLQTRVACDHLNGTLTRTITALESDLFDVMVRLEASLDFPEEGYHFIERPSARADVEAIRQRIEALLARARFGRLVRDGVRVAIIGAPNVGKSSLFNALLDARRAIVTPIAGTTRDVLAERTDIDGLMVSLFDTAGLRESADPIEREGIARAHDAAASADLVLLVLDRSQPLTADDWTALRAARRPPTLLVANKADLPSAWIDLPIGDQPPVVVSAATGEGLGDLAARIRETLGQASETREDPLVTNVRHQALLQQAGVALQRASQALHTTEVTEEFVLADLQEAAAHLQEVSGRRTTEELLQHIFQRFCIGK